MTLRAYDATRDRAAIHRIWREIGWMDKGDEEAVDLLIGAGRARVGEANGIPECVALSAPGTIRYLQEDLRLCAITTVATSLVARKLGLAKRLTAQMIALDAADGALVAGLGMFEQGYYDQLGFGTGGYEHMLAVDPAQLRLPNKPRVPRRVTPADAAEIHSLRLARPRGHGACTLFPPAITEGEMRFGSKGMGFGYADGPNGSLSHLVWLEAHEVEHGPYGVKCLVYHTREQLLELLALLKSMGDQVQLVTMQEPPGVQLQDLVTQPFKGRRATRGSRFAQGMRADAYWQLRMCDVPNCLARTRLWGESVLFNLQLTDPITDMVGEDAPWCGVAGDYVVALGPSSGAERGYDDSLPTLHASVGAFTRLWFGVRLATGLAVTDALDGPEELLQQLDRVLCLPGPKLDWDF